MVTPVNETLIAIQTLDVVCVCNGSVVKNAGKNVIKKKKEGGNGVYRLALLDTETK